MIVVFFKQKTAYEMRMSDWSSDVCSSDSGVEGAIIAALGRRARGIARRIGQRPEPLGGVLAIAGIGGMAAAAHPHFLRIEAMFDEAPAGAVHREARPGRSDQRPGGQELGRAQCRERVGPNV